jgi:hypothetical protein
MKFRVGVEIFMLIVYVVPLPINAGDGAGVILYPRFEIVA